jgi:hypothetical protein
LRWLASKSVFLKRSVCFALQRVIDHGFLVAFLVNIESVFWLVGENGTRKFRKFSENPPKMEVLCTMDVIERRFDGLFDRLC